jgi:conjugative transposon TraM protein
MISESARNSERINANSDPSQKPDLRKFKMLLVFPLLLLPFLTLAFWALGGGKGVTDKNKMAATKEGLNLDLPSANIKDDGNEDKLSFYEKAKQQEEKSKDAMQTDSLFKLRDSVSDPNKLDDIVAHSPSKYDPSPKDPSTGLNTSPIHSEKYKDATEDKIMERVKQLQQEINKPQTNPGTDSNVSLPNENVDMGSDVDRLEGMMKMMQDKKEGDPEMQKLEGMLDKILDIQHPDRVKERLKEKSMQQKTNAFPVLAISNSVNSSLLTSDTNGKEKKVRNGFYGLHGQTDRSETQNAVEAVVNETQTLVSGSVVKLRLLNDVYINGTLIPKDNFLFGTASVEGERLNIDITTIRYNNSIFPVKLTVYDLDGIAGINVPGAITRDVAKQSADNSLQSLELATMNSSLAGQATTAGINAAKSLLSKKVKLVKVVVKAGYKVLLWNQSEDK